MNRLLTALLVLMLLSAGCTGGNGYTDDVEEQYEPPPVEGCSEGFQPYSEQELVVYEGFEDVAEDDPQNTIFNRWEGGGEDDYHIINETARAGNKSFRVDITPEDVTQVSGRDAKNRVEFGINPGHRTCIEVWYGWSFMIPEDFIDKPENGSGFNVITQWHDRPDTEGGQTLEENAGNNPPLSILYGQRDGLTGIGVKYGLNDLNMDMVAEVPIANGEWYDVIFHIGWSQDENGFGQIWLNGESLTDGPVTGPNMHNHLGHYWKAGLYRGIVGDDATLTNNSLHFDEFRIGMSYAAVDPSQ